MPSKVYDYCWRCYDRYFVLNKLGCAVISILLHAAVGSPPGFCKLGTHFFSECSYWPVDDP